MIKTRQILGDILAVLTFRGSLGHWDPPIELYV